MASSNKDHKGSVKTVKKWEKEFKCNLEVSAFLITVSSQKKGTVCIFNSLKYNLFLVLYVCRYVALICVQLIGNMNVF